MLYRAFLLLATSFFLAMDGTMAQDPWTSGAVTYQIVTVTAPPSPSPGPPTSTTYLDVSFYHDEGNGPYTVSYYYATFTPGPSPTASCDGPAPAITASVIPLDISSAAPPPSPESSCGLSSNPTEACEKKTTYRYKLQDLNAITDGNIKSTDTATTPKTTVKFCVRNELRLTTSSGPVLGFKNAAVKLEWTTDSSFDSVVVTNEDGPDEVDVPVGAITAEAQLCSQQTPSAIPQKYEQGQQVQICIWAKIATASTARVVIVDVNQFNFWIDAETTPNNIYNNGETNQDGIVYNSNPTSSSLVGSTELVPAAAISGGSGICDQQFSPPSATSYIGGATDPGYGQKGCVLTTLLTPGFFNGDSDVSVKYAGIVTIEFTNGNRRSLALKSGDKIAKPFSSVVTTVSRAAEDDSCECDGFFFFICMIWCFIFG